MKATKILTIFAGINGAGKSTLFKSEDKKEELGVRLNSDELIHDMGGDWRDAHVQIKAGKEILQKQKECFEKGVSFNRETTLCGAEIFRTMKRAKELGYKIHLCYVGVDDSKIAKDRIKKRMSLGGHGVSNETIERRFDRAKENFIKAIPLCDKIAVYDNSAETLVYIAYSLNGQLCRTKYPCKWFDEWEKDFNFA